MREWPLTRIRLPYGEGQAWLATRHDDVKPVTNDPRFSRAEVTGRQVTRTAPHFKPRPGSLAFADQPHRNRLRKAVAGAFTVGVHCWTRQIVSTSGGAEAADRAKNSLYERILQTIRSRADADLNGHRINAGDPVYVPPTSTCLRHGTALLHRRRPRPSPDGDPRRAPAGQTARATASRPADQVAWRRKTMIRGPRTLPCAW